MTETESVSVCMSEREREEGKERGIERKRAREEERLARGYSTQKVCQPSQKWPALLLHPSVRSALLPAFQCPKQRRRLKLAASTPRVTRGGEEEIEGLRDGGMDWWRDGGVDRKSTRLNSSH